MPRQYPSTREQGTQAEARAADFLSAAGLVIRERQFAGRYGEIDLIAQDGNETVFVEVKMRRTARFGTALEAVTRSKLARLQKTAAHWLRMHHREHLPYRIDVVAIDGDLLEWLKGVY